MHGTDDGPGVPVHDDARHTVSASRVADEASYLDVESRRGIEASAMGSITAYAQAQGLEINSEPRPLWMIATDLQGHREAPHRRHLEIEVDVRGPR